MRADGFQVEGRVESQQARLVELDPGFQEFLRRTGMPSSSASTMAGNEPPSCSGVT